MADYDPGSYERFPHRRYRCPCGFTAIAIGNEVEALKCGECGSLMEWDEDLHHPYDPWG